MSSYTIVNTSYLNINGHKECSTADCVSVCVYVRTCLTAISFIFLLETAEKNAVFFL